MVNNNSNAGVGIMSNYSNIQIVIIILGIIIILWNLISFYNKYKAEQKKLREQASVKRQAAECPDYWDVVGKNKCKNVHRIGVCRRGEGVNNVIDFNNEIFTNPKSGQYRKCQWSQTCKAPWEGVDNICSS